MNETLASVVGKWSFSVTDVARLAREPRSELSSIPRTFWPYFTACRGVHNQSVVPTRSVTSRSVKNGPSA